jgi:hypothetical protein
MRIAIIGSGRHAIDTGFIIYNESNYPLFTKLLDRLAVPTQPSNMSFGVHCDVTDLEYSSATMGTLFAQRRNLVSPGFENRDEVQSLGFEERFRRLWEFYFCSCEGGFAEAILGSVQVVWAKPMRKGSLQRRIPEHMVALA